MMPWLEQEENILISVEKLLEKGEFEKATLKTVPGGFSYDTIEALKGMFRKYNHLSECEKCGTENLYLIKWQKTTDGKPSLGYRNPPCKKCETVKIKAEMLNNIHNIMNKCGVPKRFLNAIVDDFKELNFNDLNLYIVGPCGTGKTHFLAALVRKKILSAKCRIIEDDEFRVFEKPQTFPYFISIPDLLLKIRASFKDDSTTEEEIIERFSNIDILMLDDIGSEKPTEWVLQTLYLIIDHRYRELKETYITSNLSLDQLAERLSDRIASRIAGMCKVLKLEGNDRRIL